MQLMLGLTALRAKSLRINQSWILLNKQNNFKPIQEIQLVVEHNSVELPIYV